MSWETVKLGKLVDIKTGKLDVNAGNPEGRYPFFTCAKKAYSIDFYDYDCECVLVAGNGDLNVKYFEGKFNAYQRTYIITSVKGVDLDIKYLFFFIDSYIEKLRQGSIGGVIKYIKLGHLTEMDIPLPPLSVQKKIAAVLEKADTLRGQCQQMEQEFNTLAQSVFLDMFGDPVTNPMEWRKAGLKSISKKFNDGPFGSNLKTSHYTETGVQVIRLTNIGVGEFKNKDQMFVSEEHAETLSKFQCSSGDVVIATLGEPNLRACIIPDEVPLSINKADCIHCIPDGEVVGTEYLIEFLNLPFTLQSIQNLLHGQTRTRISSGQLAKVEILLPPLDKQEEFISFVKKRNAELIRVKAMYEQYNEFFNSLMQRAFKGVLELKDVA